MYANSCAAGSTHTEVHVAPIVVGPASLAGYLRMPANATGMVLFAHTTGRDLPCPRDRVLATLLYESGLATLWIDLLTSHDEIVDLWTCRRGVDIVALAERLAGVADWLVRNPDTAHLGIGYLASRATAGAALVAAAQHPTMVDAVVSCGGRPHLARQALAQVRTPTLLIVGAYDFSLIEVNEEALAQLPAPKRLEFIPGATHLFEEPGTLETAARLACAWFTEHVGAAHGGRTVGSVRNDNPVPM